MEVAGITNSWINTADSNTPEVIEQARRTLASTIYCTLSTCTVDGFPWVSPVFFAFDEHLNIYWSSAVLSQHSQNIDSNSGRMAIAIFNSSQSEGNPEGLYFSGLAEELKHSDAIEVAFKLLSTRAKKQPNRTATDYLGDSPRRIYRFEPKSVWVTGERIPVGNQLVDTKVSVSLADLICVISKM
jgi:nitroimidazol reductase NimA-like FMN-containing flavoprotein (pyridoxamine 5'-phosphate oxidase superfamily)